MTRRAFTRRDLAPLALGALAAPSIGRAQGAFPTRAMRWIVPYAAGGGSDFLARTLAQAMSGPLGQTIVVENRPGGATIPATDAVAKGTPDGYTFLSADMTALVINPAGFARLPYDPIRDLQPIGLTARFNFLVAVNPNVQARTMQDLVALARANPGRLNFASPGIGSPSHLATERFQRSLGIQVTHVPYRGGAPAANDLVAGVVDAMFIDYASAAPQIQGNRIRPLAATAPTRLGILPDLPTLREQGINDADIYSWQGIVAPAGTPMPIVERLSAELRRAVENPEVVARLRGIGLDPLAGGPSEYAALIQSETAIWGRLIRNLGLNLEN